MEWFKRLFSFDPKIKKLIEEYDLLVRYDERLKLTNSYLTKEEKARDFIQDKLGGREWSCEICNSTKWHLGSIVVSGIPYIEGSPKINFSIMPTIVFLCDNCGNTKFFNAIRAGVVEP